MGNAKPPGVKKLTAPARQENNDQKPPDSERSFVSLHTCESSDQTGFRYVIVLKPVFRGGNIS